MSHNIEELKSRLEKAKTDKVKAETELEQVLKTLKEKYNVSTIEEIEALIIEKDTKLVDMKDKQTALLEEADDLLRTTV